MYMKIDWLLLIKEEEKENIEAKGKENHLCNMGLKDMLASHFRSIQHLLRGSYPFLTMHDDYYCLI